VDQPDVVAAKRRLLVERGAEVPRALQMARSKSQAAIEAKIGSLDHHAQRTQHPLRAAAWDSVAADLTKPGEDGQAAFYLGHPSPDATWQPDGGIRVWHSAARLCSSAMIRWASTSLAAGMPLLTSSWSK
jgi:hypothetical protein